MYGMVNKAVEDMVCRDYGAPTWERIKERAGVDTEVFLSNEPYADEVTYRLVAAASELLGTPAANILEAFGEHWVLHTAQEGYGPLMRAAGRSLPEFLVNLPNFHSRVAMIFPKLQPPRFECTDITSRSLKLHYFTHRPGLESFVGFHPVCVRHGMTIGELARLGNQELGGTSAKRGAFARHKRRVALDRKSTRLNSSHSSVSRMPSSA